VFLWAAGIWLPVRAGSYVSIGYKVASLLIIAAAPYVAIKAAKYGETMAADLAPHFDSRRPLSILGVRWFHCFWIPVYLYGFSILLAPILLALLNSIRVALRAGIGLLSMVPFLIASVLFFCAQIAFTGAGTAYTRLAAIESVNDKRSMFRSLFMGPALMAAVDGLLFLLSMMLQRVAGAQ
jgi:hypothetical protein